MARWLPLLIPLLLLSMLVIACPAPDDDFVSEEVADDDNAGDDDADDDVDDDDSDDEEEPDPEDIYVALWPQYNVVEIPDYDETPEPGPMRLKAMDYDAWHEGNHQPFYGSTVGVLFTDDSRSDVEFYFDTYDSSMWTGTYLASQAARYHITGEEQARQNALKTVQALHHHLRVTGKPGFLGRYCGPQDPLVLPPDCAENPRCHLLDEGPYAGDFWWGDTSRDQYIGFFFGYSLAYDLIEDEAMRETIRGDIREILNALIDNHWMIIDVDGRPTGAFNVLPSMAVSWTLVGYHITGDELFREELQKWIRNVLRPLIRFCNITIFNRYTDHYGNNLGHETFYMLLRLARAYLGADDYDFFLRVFDTQQHTFTRLSHNAFFNTIHMSQGVYESLPEGDPYQAQLEQDLFEFRPAPNYQYAVTPPPAELDPVSVWIHDLVEAYPFLEPILGGINYQAEEAYPVFYQCSTDFLWQRNPWALSCGETEMPRKVQPGVDYLAAYWLASYHKFITKDQ